MTGGSPSKPNFFMLLGLDPDAPWDEARFERALRQKADQWSRQSNGVGTSPTTRAAKQHLRLLPEIEAVMRDPGDRAVQAKAGRKDRAAAVAKRRLELEERLELMLRKDYLYRAEREALEEQYPDHHDLLHGRPLGRRLERAEIRPEPTTAPRRQRLEAVTAAGVRASLEVLNLSTLYEALHTVDPAINETSSLPALQAAADKLYQQAHRTMDKSPEVSARQQLAGFAKAIFADEERRRRYDTTVSLQPLDDLVHRLDRAASDAPRVEASQVEWIIDKAQQLGIDPEETRAEVADHFARRKKPIELPPVQAGAASRSVPCWNCGAPNQAADGAVTCTICEASMTITCPRCSATVPGDAKQCGKCELRVWRRGYIRVTVEDLEAALQRNDTDLARAKLTEARRDWSLPADSEDELAVRISRSQTRLDELLREERRGTAERSALVATMMDERRYEAARDFLRRTPQRFPRREQLLTEAVRLIREADKLYRQAIQSGVGNERRAELLTQALQVCADHRHASQALAAIPPPPPRNLRAVPSAAGDTVHLAWQQPQADQVSFIVVRRTGHPPVSARDGTRVAIVTEPSCDDLSPEPGLPLWYAVFTNREGRVSERGEVVGEPVLLTRTVEITSRRPLDGEVRLAWTLPAHSVGVEVWRQEIAPAAEPRRRSRLDSTEPNRLVDRDVTNGVRYRYSLSATFRGSGETLVRSEAVHVELTPGPPPQPPTALRVISRPGTLKLYRQRVELQAPAPERGTVRIVKSDEQPLLPDMGIPEQDLSHHGTVLPPQRSSEPVTDVFLERDPHLRYYIPVTVLDGLAYAGRVRRYASVEEVGNLVAARRTTGICLSWTWPEDCREVLIAHDFTVQLTDPTAAANQTWVRREGAERYGSYDLRVGDDQGPVPSMLVAAVERRRGEVFVAAGVAPALVENRRVFYELLPRQLGRGVRAASQLRLWREQAHREPLLLPATVLVGKQDAPPARRDDGERIHQIQPVEIGRERLFPLPKLSTRPLHWRLFLQEEVPDLELVHPAPVRLRLR